jgi:protein-tyrosine kinase
MAGTVSVNVQPFGRGGFVSKIFSALKKAQGELASIASPVIEMAEAGNIDQHEMPEPDPSASELHVKPAPAPPQESRSKINRTALRPRAASVIPTAISQRRVMEEYRMIRTKIIQHPKQPKLMVVSSAGPGDGKTVSSVNLACVMALRDNVRVLLIDADLRRSRVGSMLGIRDSPGLSDVLSGSATLQESIVQTEQFPNLYVLPGGESRRNVTELLDSSDWKSLCESTSKNFDFVIVDSPPVGVVADFELIQAACQAVILVARPDHTDLSVLRKAFELVSKEKLIGVVVNCSYDWFLWKTPESYYYGYSSDSVL